MGCTEFRDYMKIYLKTDVLLLVDIFESFRDMCLGNQTGYGLDPCHYFTAPGMAWDGALKAYGGELEVLQDLDMILMFEKGMRGGISMISHRYAKANNPYLQNYEKNKENSYIMNMDMNNLYGGAMLAHLPVRNFKKDEGVDKYTEDLIKNMKDDAPKGATFMVDLECSNHLHDKHNDYPLCPERMEVTKEMFSPHNVNLTLLAKEKCKSSTKLVPNFHKKINYVIHYRALKQCLQLGMKLTKVHKVITYDQEPWLKKYIESNTKNRIIAKLNKNAFLADFYKLMNNSVFGKTMENVRNHTKINLMVDYPDVELTPCQMSVERKLLRRLAKINLSSVTIFNPYMCAVTRTKSLVVMDKPIYCGQSILDISKTFMYDFHYNVMQAKYGYEGCRLLMTDTDSLCYHIKTNDIYLDMLAMQDKFDCSAYPKDHPLYSKVNCAVICKMKDVNNGIPIAEFVGLKPKMYGLRTEEIEELKAKGVVRYVVKKDLCFDDYKNVLDSGEIIKRDQNTIRSFKHQLYTIKQNKIALSAIDTKRWIKDDGVSSFAHGHYQIPI